MLIIFANSFHQQTTNLGVCYFLILHNTEYDDYYGAFDDEEDDFNEDAFEAKYLSSGIDLNAADDNNKTSTINKSRQKILDEVRLSSDDITPILVTQSKSTEAEFSIKDSVEHEAKNSLFTDSPSTPTGSKGSIQPESVVDSVASDLTRIAIQHLDKYQWRLPLMEMDKKFRDKTYYKHYTDTYISSLHSKLGHFLADNSLITNPMKYHLQQELDNYSKYSRMFELLTDYYQSIGGGFFSFSTPSPDEEIAIGCRLGTKGYYPTQAYDNNRNIHHLTNRPSSCHNLYETTLLLLHNLITH